MMKVSDSMAISGSGTQADPYVINNSDGQAWSNFTTLNSNYTGKYITFADVHVDGNGNYDISGTGTSTDPFIVSTYREMLHCTGASNIHQCKLIDNTLPDRELLYRYDAENPETHVVTSIYCRFNPALSTIDFNDLYTETIGGILVSNFIYFNGWTILNFSVSINSHGFFYQPYNQYSQVRELFLLNAMATGDETNVVLFGVHIIDSIVQIECVASLSTNVYVGKNMYEGDEWSRSSLHLTINGCSGFSGAMSNQNVFIDCVIVLDVKCGSAFGSSGVSGFYLRRSVMKGTIQNSSSEGTFVDGGENGIYDVESTAAIGRPRDGENCIFNSEKVSWSTNGWVGATSAELLSPSALRSKGLSIGVDT
jgi:hypothetical protein